MDKERRPIIGIVTTMANGIGQKQIICAAAARAQELGYDTAVFSNIYSPMQIDLNLICEQKVYELVMSEEIDGIILIAESFVNKDLRSDVADFLAQKSVPIVVTGGNLPEFDIPGLTVLNSDDSADMEKVTLHMIEEHGYRDIDILTGQKDNEISEKRVKGYISALRRHGIEPDEKKIHYGDFWLLSGEELAKSYISGEKPMPQAVVCASDYMAYGMLTEFARNNIRVPEQIAVAGYEHSDRRVLHYPLLTSFQRGRAELGRSAVDHIHSILSGTEPPEFTPPECTLVKGDSCPCGKDVAQYCKDLEYSALQKDYSDWNLFSTMEQQLTSSRSMDEFISVIGSFQWLIRYVQNVYLCLYSNWYETNAVPTQQMTCRTIMPWLDNSPFEVNKYNFSAIFRRDPKPSVFYFNPIFVGDRVLGHMVLKYDNPDGYDDVFRNWLKTVTNGLEFLRMKNDIQYLSSCQDLSEYRDTLTGMYNEKGVKRAYSGGLSSGDGELYFVLLKTGLFDDAVFSSEDSGRIDGVLAAAAAVEKFCGPHDICGHISETAFVCIVRSKAGAALLSDTLSSILIRQKKYIDRAGMDSFLCVSRPCEDLSYEELLSQCLSDIDEKRRDIAEKRSQIHYSEVIELRNSIYSAPEFTFDTEGIFDSYSGNANHLRMLYKKCFGISFHQDCISARLAKARYYLATTSLSMTDVAEKCGYLDSKYFLRQFSSAVGMTAGQYRNMIKR